MAEAATSRAEAEGELERLANEHAALRRVATLVAQGVAADNIFGAVTVEIAELFAVPLVGLFRYGSDRTATAVAGTRRFSQYVGRTWRLARDDPSVLASVLSTGIPARVDGYSQRASPGSPVETARELGVESSVGVPILVNSRAWGAVVVGVQEDSPSPPENIVDRLVDFTELVAIAIFNVESRSEVTRLAEEQAALQRVATLVAEGASRNEVFATVVDQVSRAIGVPLAEMTRYDEDGMVTVLASTGTLYPVGSRWPIEAPSVTASVYETGRANRIDDYSQVHGTIADIARNAGYRWCVGVPIIVEGRLWGLMAAGSPEPEPVQGQTEARLAKFTDLVATAIANTEARDDLHQLADEQAALRRVATLVARGASPAEVVESVSAEVGQLIRAAAAGIGRYEADGTATALGGWSREGVYRIPFGTRFNPERGTTAKLIMETGLPGRIDSYQGVPGAVAGAARQAGWHSAVGAPITVDGRLWGFVSVASTSDEPFPMDTEARLAEFTELVATAIANSESREELTASRARIVAAADDSRRRIERNLHDGAQQRLVSLGLEFRAVEATRPRDDELRTRLQRMASGLNDVLEDLQEISRGLHPAILNDGGLTPALKALARRSAVPVKLDIGDHRRRPEQVEVAAYYVVSEALTNSAKHAHASEVVLSLRQQDGALLLCVRDNGVGGADPTGGSGLTGLSDRVEALGGSISIDSPAGEGTAVNVRLPLEPAVDDPVLPN